MKILQVIPYFAWSYGGPVRSIYELSKSLSEKGHDVTIFTTDVFRDHRIKNVDKIAFETNVKVCYFRCINNWLANNLKLHISPEMRQAIKEDLDNFDVVHLHDYRSITHYYVQYYAKKYNVPYILQAHGSSPKVYGGQNLRFTVSKIFFDFFFGSKILGNSSKLIALTEKEANQYLELGGDSKKIEIIPNGIQLSEYNELPEKGIFKNKYSIQDNEKVVLYLGRIHKIKGIDLLIDAFSEVLKELEGCRLVIVGPDDGFYSYLQNKIDNLKIGDSVLFTGPLYGQEKLEAYVDADVYVLPSIYETFPMTVLESCACGTPFIITNCCGIAKIVDGIGFVIENDKDQLRNTLVSILSDDDSRIIIGENCKSFVKSRFNLPKIIDRIESLYADLSIVD
ncbi:glycosyltransferase [Methanosarcina mazei]|uniref:Glycosyltransferase n=1 Tax=Methanosarcina mazei TaxID=2209 RepID=A0A0F8QRR8_METMZ|nr:glycosyltransferase [Methanosarcina mazei]KKH68190.1 hypothetical protein DU87_06070 [Methanosarcina mazei]